jgi:Acetyltransferase (GNAT) domain
MSPIAAAGTTSDSPSAPTASRGIPDAGWDSRLLAMGGHFLQSRAWARCQERMGSTVFHCSDERWMWIGVTRQVGPFRRLYLPYGPQVADPAALADALRPAARLAAGLGCAFVQLEPGSRADLDPAQCGARRVRARQPEHTWVLDLDVDEATLRAGQTKGHRSSINAAERKGISFETASAPADVDRFLALLHETNARTRMPIYADPYYRAIAQELLPTKEATLYYAMYEGRTVAAAIVIDFGDTRYYAYAASSSAPELRRLSPAAPLVWRAVLDARSAGKTRFDFWGVAPPDQPGHPWSGFTQFKRAFGGSLVTRAGTWDLPVRSWRYRAWSAVQALRR